MNTEPNKTPLSENGRIIAWWSGGITSAVACYIAVHRFKNVEICFIDTKNEDPDTYRFLRDCEKYLYGRSMTVLSNPNYDNIEQVWDRYNTLTTAHGAICSTELKREVRESYQNTQTDAAQIFGFENKKKEEKRHKNMRRNYPEINCISLLLAFGYTKGDCISMVERFGIRVPAAYYMEFENNNCLETGCVKGGIGYWQKYKQVFPERFHKMALREHKYTNIEGRPVTICKDQSNEAKEIGGYVPVFLEPHSDYPNVKDISMFKGRQPKSLMECHGFCNTID